jgi:hypothetical protein
MIFCDLPPPAEASVHMMRPCHGFAQAGNRCLHFGIMPWREVGSRDLIRGARTEDLRIQAENMRESDRRIIRVGRLVCGEPLKMR